MIIAIMIFIRIIILILIPYSCRIIIDHQNNPRCQSCSRICTWTSLEKKEQPSVRFPISQVWLVTCSVLQLILILMGDILVKPWFEKATTSTGTFCVTMMTQEISLGDGFNPFEKEAVKVQIFTNFLGEKVAFFYDFYTWNHPPRSVLIVSHDSQMVTRHWHLKSSARDRSLLRDPISILFA